MANDKINNKLSSVNQPSKTTDTADIAATIQLGGIVKITTKNINAGQLVNGFKTLANNVDDIVDDVVEQISDDVVVVKMTNDVKQVAAKLTREVSTDTKNALTEITGSVAATGKSFNRIVISSGTPQALATAVNKVVDNVEKADLQNIAKSAINVEAIKLPDSLKVSLLAAADDISSVKLAIEKVVDNIAIDAVQISKTGSALKTASDQLKNSLFGKLISSATKTLSLFANGFNSLIGNIIEGIFEPVKISLASISIKNGVRIELPAKVIKQAIEAQQSGNVEKAVTILSKHIDASDDDIRTIVRSWTDATKASKASVSPPAVAATAFDIKTTYGLWSESGNIPDKYFNNLVIKPTANRSMIRNHISTMKREVTEIIITATGTPDNIIKHSRDINKDYYIKNQRNSNYHILITKDGDYEFMRPLDEEATLPDGELPNEHNERSIIISLVSNGILSIQQETALTNLLRDFYSIYNGIQVLGANSLDKTNTKPYFDVEEYIFGEFKKKNIIEDPLTDGPLTRTEIIKGGDN